MTPTRRVSYVLFVLLTLFFVTPQLFFGEVAATYSGDIEGYASKESINKGESITFHVSSPEDYHIDVYRIGWYGGMGGQWMTGTTTPLTGTDYGVPALDSYTGYVDANWPVAYTLNTTSSWETGYYVAKLTPVSTTFVGDPVGYIVFIVRDDSDSADVVFLPSISTYQAYNAWGDKSVYDSNSIGGNNSNGDTRAYEVSFNRPYDAASGLKYLYDGDFQMIRWLEREGYNTTYISSVDLHTTPTVTSGHQMLLSNYHDEYYTWEMRENVTNARDAGVDLAYFTSNNIYWQMRYAPDDFGNPNRRMIAYKSESYGLGLPYNSADPFLLDADPNNDRFATILWREIPLITSTIGSENQLLGGLYEAAYDDTLNYAWTVQNQNHFIYTGAGVPGGAATGLNNNDTIPTMVGDEYDRVTWGAGNDFPTTSPPTYDFDSVTPAGITILSQTNIPEVGNVPAGGGLHQASIYQAGSGAYVFNAATNRWALKLDDTHRDTTIPADSRVQIMTRNLLNQMIGSAPTPWSSNAVYIFDDGLTYLWENNEGSANYRYTADVYSGQRAIEFNATSTYPENRISLRNQTTYDSTGYNTLQIAIKATTAGQSFDVYFWDSNDGAGESSRYSISGLPVGTWQLVNIPMTTFTGSDLTDIKYFWLRNTGANGTIYVDEIAFVKTANTPPTTTGLPATNANEDASIPAINLTSYFSDAEDASADLVYSIVTNTNTSLVAPAIDNATDLLTLPLTADANGTADITVRATDSGGLSVVSTFTLTVTPVNDKPTIGTTTNQQHPSGTNTAQSVALSSWTTGITFGPADESTQAVQQYNVSVTAVSPAGFFTVAPAIDASGNLTYTPSGAEGSATIQVTVQDNGGTANGGVDTSDPVTFTIEVVANLDPTTTGITPVTVNEDAANTVINLTTFFNDVEDGAAALTYSVQTNTNTGLVTTTVDNTANTLTLAYVADANGTADITVRATDSGTKFVDSTFTVTINAVNDKPSFTAGANQAHPAGTNTLQTVNGWATGFNFGATNESGQAVAAFVVSNDNNALFTTQPAIDTSGNLTYTPNGTSGITTVTVQLRDDGGTANGGVDLSDAQTFTITISNNLPPTVNAALPAQTVNEDAADTVVNLITPTQYFTDVEDTDPATLTYSVFSNTNTALVTATVDNTADTLTLDYLPDQNGTATITIRATDSGGLFVDSNFTVTVNAVNDAPVFTKGADQNVVFGTNTAQTVSGWATAISTGPANESTQTLTGFTVTNNNNALFTVQPAIDTSGNLTYTPTGANGTATVTVTLSDDGGTANGGVDTSAAQTFTISVNPNQTPVASIIPNQSMNEDSAGITLNLSSYFSDLETPTADLIYTVTSNTNAGLFNAVLVDNVADTLTLIPTPDDSDTADLVIRATDSGGLFVDSAPFTVEVLEINDAPVMSVSGSITHPSGTSGAQTVPTFANVVTFGAPDETWQAVSAYNVYVISGAGIFSTPPAVDNTGTLTYALNGNSGTAFMQIELTDTGDSTPPPNDDTSEFVAFTISVSSGSNTAPTTTGIADVNVLEDAANSVIDLAAVFADVEDGAANLNYVVQSNTNAALFSSIAIDLATDELTLDYQADANGTSVITIQATDSGGLSITSTFTVTVTAVNDKPVFANLGDRVVPIGTTAPQVIPSWAYNFDFGPADEDASQSVNTFFVTVPTGDPIFSVDPAVTNGGDLSFTPDGTAGTATVIIQLQDTGGTANGGIDTSDSYTLTISVTNSNTAPTTTGIANVTVNENAPATSIDLTTAFNDAETASNALTYAVIGNTNPSLVTASVSNITDLLNLSYTPATNGTATITVRATDSGGLSITSVFTVTVNPVVPPPPPTDNNDGGGSTDNSTTFFGGEVDENGNPNTISILDTNGRTAYYNGQDGNILIFTGNSGIGQVISGGRLVINGDGTFNVFNNLGDVVIDRAFVLTIVNGTPEQLPDLSGLFASGLLSDGGFINREGLPLVNLDDILGAVPEAQFTLNRMHVTNSNRTFTRINEPMLITMTVRNPLIRPIENVRIDIIFDEGWVIDGDPTISDGVVTRQAGFGNIRRGSQPQWQPSPLPDPIVFRHEFDVLQPGQKETFVVSAKVVTLYPRNTIDIASIMRINGRIVEREDETIAIIAQLPNTGEVPLWIRVARWELFALVILLPLALWWKKRRRGTSAT